MRVADAKRRIEAAGYCLHHGRDEYGVYWACGEVDLEPKEYGRSPGDREFNVWAHTRGEALTLLVAAVEGEKGARA